MTPVHDAELASLLRAALAGDEVAYETFLRRIAPLLRALARRKAASWSAIDPEDIVQDALLAIHLKRHTWRSDAPVLPWLHAIARYKIVDAFRRQGRKVEVDIDDFADVLAAEETETVSERDVTRALDCLTAGQKTVVSSIGVEGRSITETAQALGMKETAVRVALHRGLATIAARFGKFEP